MKSLVFFLLLLSTSSFAQSKIEARYSKAVCNCLDQLPSADGIKIMEQNLLPCFEKSLEIDSALILHEAIKKYGDTSYSAGYKFAQELLNQTMIDLVKDCRLYFLLMDSLRYQDYKNLKPDSLKRQLSNSYKVKPSLMNDQLYTDRATIFFSLKMYDSALVNIDRSLKLNPKNVSSLYLKAWIKEIKGDYDEAIHLYDKVAELSHLNSFYIFSAVAKRKKSGT